MSKLYSLMVSFAAALVCSVAWATDLDNVETAYAAADVAAMTDPTVTAGTREAPVVIDDSGDALNGTQITVAKGAVLKLTSATGNRIWKVDGATTGEGEKPIVIVDSTSAWGLNEGGYFRNVRLVVVSTVKFWLDARTLAVVDGTVDLELVENAQVTVASTFTIGSLTNAGTLDTNNKDTHKLVLTADSTAAATASFVCPIQLSEGVTLTVPSSKNPPVTSAVSGKVAGVTVEGDNKVYAVREPRILICSDNIQNWTADTLFTYGEGTSLYVLGDTIEFTESSLVYINQGYSVALNIKIDAGKTVTFGHNSYNSDSSRNIPAGSTVTMEDGAKAAFRFWDGGRQGNAIVKNVTFNGGSVEVDEYAKLLRVVNVSGTAPIVLSSDDTLEISGSCANTIQGEGTVEVASVQRITLDDAFSGKVVMTASGFGGGQYPLSLYKKTGSTLELKGWTGWLANETAPEFTVTDPSDSAYGMSISDASSGNEWVYSFPKVKGTGTLATTMDSDTAFQPILLRDVSEFSGKIVVTKQPIIVTDADTRYAEANVGAFIVDEGKSATLTSVTATKVVVNGSLTVSTQLTGVMTTLEGKTIKETDNGDGTYTYAPVAVSTWTPACVDASADYNAETNPYALATAADLVNLAAAVADGLYTDASFRLTADIDLAETASFAGIGTAENPFAGTFDGAGFTISNVQFARANYQGFLAYLSGTVKGLTVNGASFASGEASSYGGALIVGMACAGARVEGCTAKGTLVAAHSAAGIVCDVIGVPVAVVGCTNECAIIDAYSRAKAAGIVAIFNAEGTAVDGEKLTLTGCVNKGDIHVVADGDFDGAVAGIMGFVMQANNTVVMKDCVNEGSISRTGTATYPLPGAFYSSYGKYTIAVKDEGGNRMKSTDTALGTTNRVAGAVFVGFDYAKVDGAYIETVTSLVANKTYTLLRTPDAAPAITLADDEFIAFDTTKYQNGAELTDFTGIVNTKGKTITPVETAGVLTFSPTFTLTLTWDDNVSAVSYTIGGETTDVDDLSTGSVTVKGIEPETVVSVAATAKDWYEVTSGTGSVTVDETKTVEIKTDLVKSLADVGIENLSGVSVAEAKEWADEKELTPEEINECDFAMDAYLMNIDLSARPKLEIVDICEVEGGWQITVKGTAGEADIDLGNLNGPLKVKSAATLDALKDAEGVAYDIDVRENGAAIKIAGDNKNFMQALVTK